MQLYPKLREGNNAIHIFSKDEKFYRGLRKFVEKNG